MDEFEAGTELKIGILLPDRAGLRLIRAAAELAALLLEARSHAGHAIEIAVGLAQPSERLWRQAERQIRERVPRAIVRHVDWTRVPVDNVKRMFANLPETLDMEGMEEITVPRDWGWNFQDCDLWINLADPAQGALLPLKPVTHLCLGLPERYVPDAVASSIQDSYWQRQTEAFRLWRASLVATSDPDTVTDLVSYAGVRRERIEEIPDLLDDLPALAKAEGADSLAVLWLLDGSALDDLENALQAIAAYQREGGQLKFLAATDAFHGCAEHPSLAALPTDLLAVFDELDKLPYRSLDELERIMARSGAIWSSQLAGGQADYVHDAARARLPLLAPNLPLNRRETKRLGASAILYPLDQPLALTDALHQLEQAAAGDTPSGAAREPVEAEERKASFGFLLDRMLEQLHAG